MYLFTGAMKTHVSFFQFFFKLVNGSAESIIRALFMQHTGA